MKAKSESIAAVSTPINELFSTVYCGSFCFIWGFLHEYVLHEIFVQESIYIVSEVSFRNKSCIRISIIYLSHVTSSTIFFVEF